MAIDEIVHNLPPELKLVVLYFMVRTPKVHFLKPFKAYNGGLKDAGPDTPFNFPGQWNDDGEPGVEEVSPLSGACKLSKALMEVNDGKYSFQSSIKRADGPFSWVQSCTCPLNDPKIDRSHQILTPTELPRRFLLTT